MLDRGSKGVVEYQRTGPNIIREEFRTQNSELRTCLLDPSKYIIYIDIIYKWH